MFWVFLWYYEGMSHPCFSDDVLDTWGFSSDSLRGSGVPWHFVTVGVDDGHRVLLDFQDDMMATLCRLGLQGGYL